MHLEDYSSHFRSMHRTKDGVEMPISAMEDSHLINTINLLCREVDKLKGGINSRLQFTDLQKALYNVDEGSLSKKSARGIRKLREILMPYVFEASVRNMAVAGVLQKTFERVGREDIVPVVSENLLLAEFSDDDDDEF